MNYKHFSITEREKILYYNAKGLSLCEIAIDQARDFLF